ncbi:MAG TPA: energy transducer TonB [Chitinophagaceae bacterium]|nr:energy transducer TonB [Chitinophagaceae bacterium]
MDTNKILSADLLDLVFDNRNKDYGAYELRRNYQDRIIKALVLTGLFVMTIFTGVVMANKLKPKKKTYLIPHTVVEISQIIPADKPPELILPPKKPPVQEIQREHFAQIRMVDENDFDPPPTQDDLVNALIDTKSIDGAVPDGIITFETLDENKNIMEDKIVRDHEPVWIVEIDARFDGNWLRFLERNLNGEVPINNDAPAGSYTVIIQFVVDTDGSISDITALTNHGYGLEQEAIRVIKKATKWEPAFQNGRHVKAYRKQPITFRVEAE